MKQYFLDSNIVVYANDRRSEDKQKRAVDVITQLMRSQRGAISLQVMQEYANTALTKLNQQADIVLRQLRSLEALRLVVPSPDTVRRQIEIRQTYSISFWDAGIVAAAEEGRCDTLLSEDLNDGQLYSGIRVVNPFKEHFSFRD